MRAYFHRADNDREKVALLAQEFIKKKIIVASPSARAVIFAVILLCNILISLSILILFFDCSKLLFALRVGFSLLVFLFFVCKEAEITLEASALGNDAGAGGAQPFRLSDSPERG